MAGQPSASRTGETLEARYRLGQQLADDGPAEVYAATDTRQGSAVVVRLLRPELALQRGAVEGFVSLPNALLNAQPPHVARVLAVTSDDTGIPFVVEEASNGQTLADLMVMEPKGLPLHEAARLVAPVIEAVARMHVAGLVHGHLEPGRIVMIPVVSQTIPRIVHHCVTASDVRSKVAYQAPEQRDRSAPLDPSMDVWALGALMHHVFTGRLPPAVEPSVAELAQALSGVPAALVSALHDCLRVEPSQRLLDAAVLWMRVEGALAQAAKPAVDKPAVDKPAVDKPRDPSPVAVADAFAPLQEEQAAVPVVAPKAAPMAQAKPAVPVARARPVGVQLADAGAPSKNFPVAATQRARAAGGLSASQLNSVLALDNEREHRAWPWIRIALLLLLLLLVYKAVPFLTEPDLVAARRVFGPQLQIVGIALGVVMVAALVSAWAVSVKGNALLVRPMVYSFQVVALCVLVLVGGSLWFGFGDASAYGGAGTARAGGAAWRVAGGYARMVLPYGAALMMSFGALYGLVQGLRSFRDAIALSAATLLLALGGGAASFSIAVTTIKPELQKRIEAARAETREDSGQPDIGRIKQSFGHKAVDVNAQHEPRQTGDQPELRQRTSIGDGDDETLIMEDMKRQRAHQQGLIKSAEKELPPAPRR